jgi:hypothetical protein
LYSDQRCLQERVHYHREVRPAGVSACEIEIKVLIDIRASDGEAKINKSTRGQLGALTQIIKMQIFWTSLIVSQSLLCAHIRWCRKHSMSEVLNEKFKLENM